MAMRLSKLLKTIYPQEIPNPFATYKITSLSCDSRRIHPNGIFIAIAGTTQDGTQFIQDAISKGAKVIVENKQKAQTSRAARIPSDVCLLRVKDTKKFLKKLSRQFYGNPSQTVKTIGITGTNGKTTVSYLIEAILKQGKKSCGVLGTINYRIGPKILPSVNTTPGIIDNQKFLFDLAKHKVPYCVMEVSSHALDQGRVDLIDFQTAVFTNLTSDHLDYHQNTENYFQAKAKLFLNLSAKATAVINIDDEYGRRLVPLQLNNIGRNLSVVNGTSAPHLDKKIVAGALVAMTKSKIVTYGFKQRAAVMAEHIQTALTGLVFVLKTPRGKVKIQTRLIGYHNVYNILAAASAAYAHGVSLSDIQKAIGKFTNVPGRLEKIENKRGCHIFVDYAHTEDGLKNVLSTFKEISPARIILVFGCGGDRDKTKRPAMGQIAGELADFTIVTSDNPRSEDPQAIIEQILTGFTKLVFKVILDREAAIREALRSANEGDIVLIAGKGHEDYQIFKDKTIPFDDRQVVRNILSEKNIAKDFGK